MRRGLAAALLLSLAVAACQSLPVPPAPRPAQRAPFVETGLASWYGPGFQHKRTADGTRFRTDGMTAAHRSLPLNSRVRVTNLENGRSVVVRITDRGPYAKDRIIDLSPAAARALGMKENGLAEVRIELIGGSEV